jgi:hypothetical protein
MLDTNRYSHLHPTLAVGVYENSIMACLHQLASTCILCHASPGHSKTMLKNTEENIGRFSICSCASPGHSKKCSRTPKKIWVLLDLFLCLRFLLRLRPKVNSRNNYFYRREFCRKRLHLPKREMREEKENENPLDTQLRASGERRRVEEPQTNHTPHQGFPPGFYRVLGY